MMPLSRPARVLVSIAVVSLVAMVLLYAFPASDRRTLTIIADLCWIWAAAFAAFACVASARRATTSQQRRSWRWIGAGCGSFFAGQLAWTYYDLWRGAPPPYPSLADLGYLGIYACLIMGVMTLVRRQPTRRADPELVLDTVLVTFTVGALAYEYLVEPLLSGSAPVSTAALVTSSGWSIGAVAVLWIILIQMLRRSVFPAATAALVFPGVVLFAIGNLIYAVVALRGTFQAGSPLDLTWDAGLLMIAAAAAIAPDYAQHLERSALTRPDTGIIRIVALVIGLAGMTGMAIVAILRSKPSAGDAFIIGTGLAIVAARVLYSLGVDRRYAQVLEDEVANQTRSLMSSLGATASAERSPWWTGRPTCSTRTRPAVSSSTRFPATPGRAAENDRRWGGSRERPRALRASIWPRPSMVSYAASRSRFNGPTAATGPATSCSLRCAKAAASRRC